MLQLRNIAKIDNAINDISMNLGHNLKNAMVMSVKLEISPKTSLFDINPIMDFLLNEANANCEIIFDSKINKDLLKEFCKYKITLKGIE